jgi:3-dehydroquinate synthase
MADSCLGGKSSINVGSTKNLVGNVYPPREVLIDLAFLTTLDGQSLSSGLAEGVKIAFARGSEEFNRFIENPSSLQPKNDDSIIDLIYHSLSCKKWFIEIDEFDRAERQLLNFGHSFGHAFEAATNFGVQHGIGVAVGMLAAAKHPASEQFNDVAKLVEFSKQLLKPHRDQIKTAVGQMDWHIFENALASDKKNTKTELVLILPTEGSRLAKVHLPFENDAVKTASQALHSALQEVV